MLTISGISESHSIAVNKYNPMGTIIEAKCICGFTNEMFLGGGKLSFQTYAAFPYYCKSCKSLFVENFLAENKSCKKCSSTDILPYYDDTLRSHASNKEIFGWNVDKFTLKLTDDKYLCPKCGEYSLIFTPVGYWD
jgi:ribosomal protein S27AE